MEEKSKKRSEILIGIVTHLTSLSPSMCLGFSAILLPALTGSDNPHPIDNNQASWLASSVTITYPMGCISSGWLSDTYGRKPIIILCNFVAFAGWLIVYLGYVILAHQYLILIIGNLITGFSVGMALPMPILYMTEIATASSRSMFTTWNSIASATGVLLVFSLSFYFQQDWGKVAIIAAVLPIISVILAMIYLPESPLWLISQNRIEEAQNCCKMLGHPCPESLKTEKTPLLLHPQHEQSNCLPLYQRLLKPTSWKPMIIVLSFAFFAQFSGVFEIVAYAIDFAEALGINLNPYCIICILGVTRLIGSLVLGVISNNFGRRPLSLVSGVGMSVSMLGMATYLLLISKYDVREQSFLLSSTAVLLVVVYFFAATIGFIAIPYSISSEVFPLEVRGFACSFVTFVDCIMNFINVKIYFNLITWLGSYSMLLFWYGVISLLGTVWVYCYLPETKGKTLDEIEKSFL